MSQISNFTFKKYIYACVQNTCVTSETSLTAYVKTLKIYKHKSQTTRTLYTVTNFDFCFKFFIFHVSSLQFYSLQALVPCLQSLVSSLQSLVPRPQIIVSCRRLLLTLVFVSCPLLIVSCILFLVSCRSFGFLSSISCLLSHVSCLHVHFW